ncbi:hypothetical protein D3C87_1709250 [compost metagenome]
MPLALILPFNSGSWAKYAGLLGSRLRASMTRASSSADVRRGERLGRLLRLINPALPSCLNRRFHLKKVFTEIPNVSAMADAVIRPS